MGSSTPAPRICLLSLMLCKAVAKMGRGNPCMERTCGEHAYTGSSLAVWGIAVLVDAIICWCHWSAPWAWRSITTHPDSLQITIKTHRSVKYRCLASGMHATASLPLMLDKSPPKIVFPQQGHRAYSMTTNPSYPNIERARKYKASR